LRGLLRKRSAIKDLILTIDVPQIYYGPKL
jgi:hypothetical protein